MTMKIIHNYSKNEKLSSYDILTLLIDCFLPEFNERTFGPQVWVAEVEDAGVGPLPDLLVVLGPAGRAPDVRVEQQEQKLFLPNEGLTMTLAFFNCNLL